LGIYKCTWYCRWCGMIYRPLKETDRDGPCSPACKQALHRAVKKYNQWKLSRKSDRRNKKSGTRPRRNANKGKIHIPKKEWNGKLPGPTLCGITKSRNLHIEFWNSLRGKAGIRPIDQIVCEPCYKIYIRKRKQ